MKYREEDSQSRESPKHPKMVIISFDVAINCRTTSGASALGGIQSFPWGVQSKNRESLPVEKICQAVDFARCKVTRST
jgi:hypothetical protein